MVCKKSCQKLDFGCWYFINLLPTPACLVLFAEFNEKSSYVNSSKELVYIASDESLWLYDGESYSDLKGFDNIVASIDQRD